MTSSHKTSDVDTIIPGVTNAYHTLRPGNGMGIYTSMGRFYNHTLFGRDASLTAKFVLDFDHEVAVETITALAALQGTTHNPVTQEEPGRIHHEYRDFTTWNGSFVARTVFWFLRKKWGAESKRLLTYFAVDTTASYIRLVNKYAYRVDRSILDKQIVNQHGQTVSVRDTVVRAADWLMNSIDALGHFAPTRTNSWSLPFQVHQDSLTAYTRHDKSIANYKQPISYVSCHTFACDALSDMTKLLSEHKNRHLWQESAHILRDSFVRDFLRPDGYFTSAIDATGQLDIDNISVGWVLNNSFWNELDSKTRIHHISAIVKKLFSEDFLTHVGLRTRALTQPAPLPGLIEYHGRLTVWPMFTFMVIEGLRRHGLYRLSHELENRLINGINLQGSFQEFFVVQADGTLLIPGRRAKTTMKAQMLPEENIAFTVVPAYVLAKRIIDHTKHTPHQHGWQAELEADIMRSLQPTERIDPVTIPDVAKKYIVPVRYNRFLGTIQTAGYFLKQSRTLPKQ